MGQTLIDVYAEKSGRNISPPGLAAALEAAEDRLRALEEAHAGELALVRRLRAAEATADAWKAEAVRLGEETNGLRRDLLALDRRMGNVEKR